MPPQTDSEAWHHQRTASKHNGATTRAHGGMKTIKAWKAAAASGSREHGPVTHAENPDLEPEFVSPTGSEPL